MLGLLNGYVCEVNSPVSVPAAMDFPVQDLRTAGQETSAVLQILRKGATVA